MGNLELVEAEQRRLVCDLGSGARDRVGRGLAAALDRLMRSAMNSWKCTRRFGAKWTVSKKRSSSMVLPRPTPP